MWPADGWASLRVAQLAACGLQQPLCAHDTDAARSRPSRVSRRCCNAWGNGASRAAHAACRVRPNRQVRAGCSAQLTLACPLADAAHAPRRLSSRTRRGGRARARRRRAGAARDADAGRARRGGGLRARDVQPRRRLGARPPPGSGRRRRAAALAAGRGQHSGAGGRPARRGGGVEPARDGGGAVCAGGSVRARASLRRRRRRRPRHPADAGAHAHTSVRIASTALREARADVQPPRAAQRRSGAPRATSLPPAPPRASACAPWCAAPRAPASRRW